MKNPEIKKLIDLAIADGQVTEKERNVILKKATEFGIDTDEVEMVLEGKLHQLQANEKKQIKQEDKEDDKEKKSSDSGWFFWTLGMFMLYLMISFVASWFGAKYWPFN